MGEIRKQKLPTRRVFVKTSGTKVRIAIRHVVPVDVELRVVPIHVRYVAIAVARTFVASLHPYHREPWALCIYEFPTVLAGVVLSKASSFIAAINYYLSTSLTIAISLYTKSPSTHACWAKGYKVQGLRLGPNPAGTKGRIAIRHVAPADVELRDVPIHARYVAIAVART